MDEGEKVVEGEKQDVDKQDNEKPDVAKVGPEKDAAEKPDANMEDELNKAVYGDDDFPKEPQIVPASPEVIEAAEE